VPGAATAILALHTTACALVSSRRKALQESISSTMEKQNLVKKSGSMTDPDAVIT
jgi:hypothetical protein